MNDFNEKGAGHNMCQAPLLHQETESDRARIEEYRKVLECVPNILKCMDDSFDEYRKIKGKEMPLATKLYLLAIAIPLVSYAEWVLKEAKRDGKERLYFLSRDGYQIYLIAKKIAEKRKTDIECRYLNVSRLSMRLPSYCLDIDKSVESICVGGIDVTPFKILRRGGLSEKECEEVLSESGLSEGKANILNYNEVMGLREKLKDNDKLKQFILSHSKAAFDTATGYLKQEGLCRDSKFAIVDSGWIGTLQESIDILVKSVNPDINVTGYYFGLYDTPKGMDDEYYKAYYFMPKRGLKRKSTFSNSLFEAIVSSDEGMTLEYEQKDGNYVPKTGVSNPNALTIDENAGALKIFIDLLIKTESPKEVTGESELTDGSLCETLFRMFMAEPTETEVKCYGDMLFSDDVSDAAFKKAAAELSWEDIKNQRFLNKFCIVTGIKKAVIHESSWIEGSVVRAGKSHKETKKEFKHIRNYKRFVFARKQLLN
ncbi:MAG: hypothetical protein K6G75_06310 [Lachnospiraceae bacterium]|nr:hypothetical protein [Lachnospiraceae bacterium]